jgi:hypothetical protein
MIQGEGNEHINGSNRKSVTAPAPHVVVGGVCKGVPDHPDYGSKSSRWIAVIVWYYSEVSPSLVVLLECPFVHVGEAVVRRRSSVSVAAILASEGRLADAAQGNTLESA